MIFEYLYDLYLNETNNARKVIIEQIVLYLDNDYNRKFSSYSKNYINIFMHDIKLNELFIDFIKEKPLNSFIFNDTLEDISNEVYKNIYNFFSEFKIVRKNNRISCIFDDILLLEFFIAYDDTDIYVRVSKLMKGKFSGKELLNRLENLIQKVNRISMITLEDESKITWKTIHGDYIISLNCLYILSYGQSWYNSLGYKQKEFESDQIISNKLRNTKLTDYLISYEKKYVHNMNFIDNFKNMIPFIHKYFNINDTIGKICKDIFFLIKIKDLNINIEYLQVLLTILELCSYGIEYSYSNLIKKIYQFFENNKMRSYNI
uniref:Uncharacterized protein n=1 Tax=viral metagenome TaxID=1070528 RepID=A0A6C0AFM7_9ZZZZ